MKGLILEGFDFKVRYLLFIFRILRGVVSFMWSFFSVFVGEFGRFVLDFFICKYMYISLGMFSKMWIFRFLFTERYIFFFSLKG